MHNLWSRLKEATDVSDKPPTAIFRITELTGASKTGNYFPDYTTSETRGLNLPCQENL